MSKYIPSTRPNKAVAHSLTPHKERIIELYNAGHGTRPIAREIGNGVVHSAIYKALMRWGVGKKGDPRSWNKGKKFKPGERGVGAILPPENEAEIKAETEAQAAIMRNYRMESDALMAIDEVWTTLWVAAWRAGKKRSAKLAHYSKNKSTYRDQSKKWRQQAKGTERFKAWRSERDRKLRLDPMHRIQSSLRCRLWKEVSGLASGKQGRRSMELLGCSSDEFRAHIERQFKRGMAWDNYGSHWHVDHITPMSYFDLSKPDEMARCSHFTNLRPLEARENISRGNRVGLIQPSLGL